MEAARLAKEAEEERLRTAAMEAARLAKEAVISRWMVSQNAKQLVALAVLTAAIVFRLYVEYTFRNFHIDYSEAKGKVFVVTGGNSGIGLETALRLTEAGGDVVIGCRDEAKCAIAIDSIMNATGGNGHITGLLLDLSSLKSVKKFSVDLLKLYSSIDVLINNAGVMALANREVTADGFEMQIGTNHFGHFYLTLLLHPKMKQNGRIVNHSSMAHHFAKDRFEVSDLMSKESYSSWEAYGNSKLANLLFTYEFNQRLKQHKKKVIAVAVHPGYTSTNLQTGRFPLYSIANAIFAMNVREGSLSQIYAAVDPRVTASLNTYIGPQFGMFGIPVVADVSAAAKRRKSQLDLWDKSVKLVYGRRATRAEVDPTLITESAEVVDPHETL